MTPMTNQPEPQEPRIDVPVWDWPVRAVHWAIALLVAALLTTGLVGNDALVWHMRCGETLLALVLFRVIWGFVGSGNARFSSFVRGPGAVVSYVRSIFRPPHEVHATHNPIGGWMVIALLLAMLAQAGAGLFTQDDIGNEGPLVKLVSGDLSETLGWYHRRGVVDRGGAGQPAHSRGDRVSRGPRRQPDLADGDGREAVARPRRERGERGLVDDARGQSCWPRSPH